MLTRRMKSARATGCRTRPAAIPTPDKIAFVDRLSAAGLPAIEVSAFVSPKWVPQMADAEEVFAGITRRPGTRYAALVPNLQRPRARARRGRRRVGDLRRRVRDVQPPQHQPVDRRVVRDLRRRRATRARRGRAGARLSLDGVRLSVRGRRARRARGRAHASGCSTSASYEVAVSDTIGIAHPGQVRSVLDALTATVPAARDRAAFSRHARHGARQCPRGARLRHHDVRRVGRRPRRLPVRARRHRQSRHRRSALPARTASATRPASISTPCWPRRPRSSRGSATRCPRATSRARLAHAPGLTPCSTQTFDDLARRARGAARGALSRPGVAQGDPRAVGALCRAARVSFARRVAARFGRQARGVRGCSIAPLHFLTAREILRATRRRRAARHDRRPRLRHRRRGRGVGAGARSTRRDRGHRSPGLGARRGATGTGARSAFAGRARRGDLVERRRSAGPSERARDGTPRSGSSSAGASTSSTRRATPASSRCSSSSAGRGASVLDHRTDRAPPDALVRRLGGGVRRRRRPRRRLELRSRAPAAPRRSRRRGRLPARGPVGEDTKSLGGQSCFPQFWLDRCQSSAMASSGTKTTKTVENSSDPFTRPARAHCRSWRRARGS